MVNTLEERCRKFATRNYLNSDDEVVATVVDRETYENALVVAKTIQKEMIGHATDWFKNNWKNFIFVGPKGEVSFPNMEEEFKKAMEKTY